MLAVPGLVELLLARASRQVALQRHAAQDEDEEEDGHRNDHADHVVHRAAVPCKQARPAGMFVNNAFNTQQLRCSIK